MRYSPSARYGYAPAVPVQTLLGQVLGITAVGLLVTACTAYSFQNISYGVGMIAMVAGFLILLAINATRANQALSLTMFYVFAALEGIGIAPVVHAYAVAIGPQVVIDAAATSGLGMAALGCVVYATGLDLRRFQGIIMLALVGLILAGIVSAFTHWMHPGLYSWITLAIFTALVLIDFARIRAGGDGLTPVQLAVQIYLDAINIFLAVLQLLGARRSRD